MCGLAGIVAGRGPVSRELLLAMGGELAHRGPDGVGLYLDGSFGMVNTRLAVVDLAGGDQPIGDGSGRFWAMQNGEVYNHVELRQELEGLGHRFVTTSDTEVLLHAYRQWGSDCLPRLNGDFAFAVWDRARRELFLARDRFGVRPLFLARYGSDLVFASEMKALLRHPEAPRELDPAAIVDYFSLWGTLPDRAPFRGIRELAAAHFLIVRADGSETERRWWQLDFTPSDAPADELLDELRATLDDATRIRLRADVEVGSYLSGGLDSTLTAALGKRHVERLSCFGLGFDDPAFDESREQDTAAAALGLSLERTVVDGAAISSLFPETIRLSERPTLRTAPAPLLLLSALVRTSGLKVVITGEGADELFAGYDLFREDAVRRFWARDPNSALRPALLGRLNAFVGADLGRSGPLLAQVYGRGLVDTDDRFYSHRIRLATGARLLRVLDPDLVHRAESDRSPLDGLSALLPASFSQDSPLARAQTLEIATFLEGFLLHSQGDRMLMGNGVEGRFPFLDYRVAELAARLPDRLRLRGLHEKYALRAAFAGVAPQSTLVRKKRPYRAPIAAAFTGAGRPEYVDSLLDERRMAEAGLLSPATIAALRAKLDSRAGVPSESDEMALVGSLSLMLLDEQFVRHPVLAPAATASRIVDCATVSVGGTL